MGQVGLNVTSFDVSLSPQQGPWLPAFSAEAVGECCPLVLSSVENVFQHVFPVSVERRITGTGSSSHLPSFTLLRLEKLEPSQAAFVLPYVQCQSCVVTNGRGVL